MTEVAVVGCGYAGRAHLDAYRAMPRVRVAAVCDTDAERAERATAEIDGGAATYTDVAALLHEVRVDVVSVCVPPVAHRDVTVAALRARAHVLCEKPLAMNAREVQEMYDAADSAGRQLAAIFNMRWTPEVKRLRELVAGGAVGRVVSSRAWAFGPEIPWWGIHWHRAISGGGFVASTAVHVLDAALWVAGYPSAPTAVTATYAQLYPEKRGDSAPSEQAAAMFDTEDTAAALVRFADESWLTLEGGWVCDVPEDRSGVEVVGIRGTVRSDPLSAMYEENGQVVDRTPDDVPATSWEDSINANLRDAISRLERGDEPLVPRDEALTLQRIVDSMNRSAEVGREVEVEQA